MLRSCRSEREKGRIELLVLDELVLLLIGVLESFHPLVDLCLLNRLVHVPDALEAARQHDAHEGCRAEPETPVVHALLVIRDISYLVFELVWIDDQLLVDHEYWILCVLKLIQIRERKLGVVWAIAVSVARNGVHHGVGALHVRDQPRDRFYLDVVRPSRVTGRILFLPVLYRFTINHDGLHARRSVTIIAVLAVKLVLLIVGHRDVQTTKWLSDFVSQGVHGLGCIPYIVVIGYKHQVTLVKDV